MNKSFNVIDQPWIPVAGSGLVSLRQIFSDHSLTQLGGNPVQKIAVMKLLLAIAQAACTPQDEAEWEALGAEGLAEFDVHEQPQMTKVLRTQVDVVLRQGVAVINAHEPAAADLADLSDGDVIYYGWDAEHPVIAAHLAQGNKAVLCLNNQLVLATGQTLRPVFEHSHHPFNPGELLTDVLLATVATAWALNIPLTVIRAGIETALPTLELNPA